MTLRMLWLLAALALPATAGAQTDDTAGTDATEEPGRSDVPSTDAGLEEAELPVVTPGDDATGRDEDPMQVDADAGGNPGAGRDPMLGGNTDSVIQGGGAIVPEGTNQALPIGGGTALADVAGFDLSLSGFIRPIMSMFIMPAILFSGTVGC